VAMNIPSQECPSSALRALARLRVGAQSSNNPHTKTKPTAVCHDSNMKTHIRMLTLVALMMTWLSSYPASLSAAGPRVVTTSGLLDDMMNLAAMAEFPRPSYTCKQFSSYDRKSKTPGNDDWFANADCSQYLRVEERNGRKEFVMMDAAGPGAIVRIWSANPTGTLRVYLDGAAQPAIETPMSTLLGGQLPGLPHPIAGEYSKGWNLYFPIPYTRSCKVTSDKDGFYYHVNYRTYPAGTSVQTFSLDQLQSLAPRVQKLVTGLAAPADYESGLKEKSDSLDIRLAPGKTITRKFRGAQAITRLTMRASAGDLPAALRSVVLKITFDGEQTVEAPLGDFFGSGPGLNPFSALPVGMNQDGSMYSHWFMPFKKAALIELSNLGNETVSVTGALSLAAYRWTSASMYFHARWRVEFDVPTRPFIDWNYLTAKGQGVFAGVSFSIDNPVKEWWGEGDEKIYVDNEGFPSHFGTGTEDYYGYAWGHPETFTHAYHAQPRCDGPPWSGRISVCRFHVLDRIPFTTNFKFDMELWHWNTKTKVNIAVLPYWYAKPGGTDTFRHIQSADSVIRPMAPLPSSKVKGALEGESFKILRKTGEAAPQAWQDLSDEKHLWWSAGMKPGDTLAVAFPAPKAGKYHVFARFLSAKDYGIHQLAINGHNAGPPIDFYSPDVTPMDEKDLGVFDLKEGDNEFSTTITGANEKAVKSYMFGLDYLRLTPAE
jgi:hypothetical protein